MRKKLLAILACMLLLTSTMLIIKPENFVVKAISEGSSNGNDVGINLSYIYLKANDLSNIVKTYYKGRSYGTQGEYQARDDIKLWMNQIGLYNVHNESITYGFNDKSVSKRIDYKLEDLSFGLTINHTDTNKSEFFINPRYGFSFYPKIQIDNLSYMALLTKNFSYNDVTMIKRPLRWGFDHYLQWIIDDIKKLQDNGTIYDFESLANFVLESFAQYYNFSWNDIINNPLNVTIRNNSQWFDYFNYSSIPKGSNFTFIDQDPIFNPNPAPDLIPPDLLIQKVPDPEEPIRLFYPHLKLLIQNLLWSFNTSYGGLILYDFNNHTHDMPDIEGFPRPIIFISGALGNETMKHINDSGYYITHWWINQSWETHVPSSNVIGQINGTNQSKTIIIDCLYDCVWNQGAADSAIGIATVLAIAKYMKDHNIKPKYTTKFVAFGGEEYGALGASSYDWRNANETITTLIDLNQLGFNQTGPSKLTLGVTTNNLTANTTLKIITNDTHYIQRMNGTTNFTIKYKPGGDDSDDKVFAQAVLKGRRNGSRNCTTIGFLKDTTWTLHHRDGNNHNEGDVMKYFNWTDVSAMASMIWNVTTYYDLNPNCSVSNVSYTAFDSPNDGDTLNDSIRANFTIHSIMPSDKVRVDMDLGHLVGGWSIGTLDAWDSNYIVTNGSLKVSHIFTIPDNVSDGNYSINFKVYNSTGRINRIINGNLLNNYYNATTGSSNWSHLYHPLGYTKVGCSVQSIQNRITGSEFTANENGRADNITAYINQNFIGLASHKCMLYRENDSTLIGTTTENWKSLGGLAASPWWAVFNFTGTKPLLVKGVRYVITCWSNNSFSGLYYNDSHDPTTGAHESYTYGTPPNPAYFIPDLRYYSIYCSYTPDVSPPRITSVSDSPDTVGFGYNVTIKANVTDDKSGVNYVKAQITSPNSPSSSMNYTMTHLMGNTYQYVFTNTWYLGQYGYTIWTMDNETNINSSSGHHFHVSANATMSIATLKDSYSGTKYINITDPPNPPENYTLIGRGLTWNTYYDASSGNNILEAYQGPTNYQENNGSWTPINNSFYLLPSDHPAYSYGYRTGNTHGLFGVFFKPDISSTWPVAFAFNRSSNPTTDVIRSKLVGVGYLDPQSNWAYHYLQSVQSSQGQTNGNTITYPGVFTGTDISWCYRNTELKEAITMSNTTKTLLQNHPPSQYGLNDASSYLVFITKLDYQSLNLYNTSGLLTGNVTITDTGVDFKDVLGQFKCGLPMGEAWELNNESVRAKLTYRVVHLSGDTYLLSGLRVSDLNAMIFPIVIDPTLTVYSRSSDGHINKSDSNYNTARTASSGTVSNSASFLSIGQIKNTSGTPSKTYTIYRGFVFFNTSSLPSNAYLDSAKLSLYKKDDFSATDFDITIQNGQPTYPHEPMQTGDYNLNDYSGNGGTLNTRNLQNGYNNISLTNLNWINKNGITKLCLRSSRDINNNAPTGNEYVNVYANEKGIGYQPKLVITYRNQSKIKNTGLTNIEGYLLIQVQFYNSSQGKWLVDKDTINETSPRSINSGSQLALDSIFNGHVRASDLIHGTGTYRVYTAFRDPNGNILKTSSGVELKAWWQFSKT